MFYVGLSSGLQMMFNLVIGPRKVPMNRIAQPKLSKGMGENQTLIVTSQASSTYSS